MSTQPRSPASIASALVSSRAVVFREGRERMEPAAVLIGSDGRIAAVARPGEIPAGVPTEDLGRLALLPGVVDTHAHINEPGRTEWEGFETATRAAAVGGTTTVVDMPLNSIPATTTLAAYEAKRAAARGRCFIDHGFWGGVVPGNAGELEPMVRAGVLGFKCFLIDSGVSEFPMARREDLEQAMPILARLGVPLLVHAELESPAPAPGLSREYRDYLASRPREWEVAAIRMMIELARRTGCRTHIVHLSAADALPEIERAKATGIPITAETCPHYLSLAAEEIPAGATQFKCAPPIRERENQERLWRGLESGAIDFVVSDHSPCTPALKRLDQGDFMGAWGGIASLQLSLAVVWTEAARRGRSLEEIARWMCRRTAEFAGIAGRKGVIAPGADADLVVLDPEARFELRPEMVLHRHRLTPYAGRALQGRVERTYLRGQAIAAAGRPAGAPTGRAVLHGDNGK